MANQSYALTHTEDGKARYQALLQQLMQSVRPLYVLVMSELPESYRVAKGDRVGEQLGVAKDVMPKSLTLSDPVEFESIVTVRAAK